MPYDRRMMKSRLLGALTLGLVISAVGACWTSAAAKGELAGPAVKPPLVPATWPAPSRSKWENENQRLYKTALAKAGLTRVQLEEWYPQRAGVEARSVSWNKFGPEDYCKILENYPGAPPRLLFGGTGHFGVAADGKLYCVAAELQTLGSKRESVEGTSPSCMGGAYQERAVSYGLFVLPEGVTVGGARTVRVPFYDLDLRYEEQCPMVPSARH